MEGGQKTGPGTGPGSVPSLSSMPRDNTCTLLCLPDAAAGAVASGTVLATAWRGQGSFSPPWKNDRDEMRHGWDERMEGSRIVFPVLEKRSGCHLSLIARRRTLPYVGGHEAKRAPQLAIAPCAHPREALASKTCSTHCIDLPYAEGIAAFSRPSFSARASTSLHSALS